MPDSVSLLATFDRSEIFFSPYLSAVSFVTPTSFESTNGVGGRAVMPSVPRLNLACS